MNNHIYIKSIHLKNFQIHSDLQIDFDKGVNILWGESGTGKSCIRRAIEFVLLNNTFNGCRKQDTKETSVKIFLSNGIWIEKVKSASKNQYRLNTGKDDTVTFDSVGKTIPEEISSLIGINPIILNKEEVYLNSSAQITLPFLFDVPGTEKAKLFNVLTGNDVLDDLLVSYNKDILSLGKELKKEEINLEELTNKFLKKGNEKEEIESLYNASKEILEEIKIQYSNYSKLFELNELYKHISNSLVVANEELKSSIIPEDLDSKELMEEVDKFNKVDLIRNALILNDNKINEAILEYNKLPSDLPNIIDIQTKIGSYSILKSTGQELEIVNHTLNKAEKEYNILLKDLKDIEKERSSYKVCEVCNGLGVLKNE